MRYVVLVLIAVVACAPLSFAADPPAKDTVPTSTSSEKTDKDKVATDPGSFSIPAADSDKTQKDGATTSGSGKK